MTFINAINVIKISPSRGRRVKRTSLNKNQPRTLKITISIMNTVRNTQIKTKPFLSLPDGGTEGEPTVFISTILMENAEECSLSFQDEFVGLVPF